MIPEPLKAAVKAQPILLMIGLAFIVDTGMAAINGYDRAGGGFGPRALLYAMVFIAIAVFGSWLPVRFRDMKATDLGSGCNKALVGLLALLCFAMTQSSGWAVMGVTLADGQVKRDIRATSRETIQQKLAAARAEFSAIGVTQPIAALEALERLECSRTSKRYPDGVGPKCTEWRTKLAAAKRKIALESEIAHLMEALRRAPKVAGGDPGIANWHGFIAGVANFIGGDEGAPVEVSAETANNVRSILLVFLVGFMANFGFALVLPRGPVQMAMHAGAPMPPAGPAEIVDERAKAFEEAYRQPVERVSARHFGGAPGRTVAGADGQFSPHAPITVNVGGVASQPEATHQADSKTPGPGQPGGQEAAAGVAQPAAPSPATKPSPVSDKPVRRDHARRQADQLRTFKVACLAEDADAVIEGDELYARYRSWAGGREMSRAAFYALIADIAGIEREDAGDVVQFRGVTLRDAPQIAAVGA